MLCRLIFMGLALAALTTVQAVLFPAGLPDGLYSISFDSNGTALGDPTLIHATTVSQGQGYSRRQQGPPPLPSSQSKCGTGGAININQFATAKADLQAECDRGEAHPERTAIIFNSGTTVAYFCNYQARNRCWRQEVEEAMAKLVQACGSGKGGELYISAYSKSYGGDVAGQQICRF